MLFNYSFMTKLSVNVNKIATLRNARGNNIPNVDLVTSSIINFGADGITIHPRPDERHITRKDVFSLSNIVKNKVDFNIEGYPSKEFIELVLKIQPEQVTLVPDKPGVLTSLEGWDTIKYQSILKNIVQELKKNNIRVSVFIHPDINMVKGAAKLNVDMIELFTGIYAHSNDTIDAYINCSQHASQLGIQVNAGHDLDLKNLPFFIKKMPFLNEVSIGHALISESLFLGLEKTINQYKKILA